MTKVLEVTTADNITSHPHSIAITAPDRVTFVKGTCPEETKWWFNVLAAFPKSKVRSLREWPAFFCRATNPPPTPPDWQAINQHVIGWCIFLIETDRYPFSPFCFVVRVRFSHHHHHHQCKCTPSSSAAGATQTERDLPRGTGDNDPASSETKHTQVEQEGDSGKCRLNGPEKNR
ncbi:AGAP009848-PA-like protein [Anopheles sinensis]|uniref:AGAP009848-PA-like protein n=1 Tax=Anopheles sinensis TaxID=74873 RepID=A0A084W8V8_ANOSI|nr:AGAP009848-PA-like protein [Anopheles sinensis]